MSSEDGLVEWTRLRPSRLRRSGLYASRETTSNRHLKGAAGRGGDTGQNTDGSARDPAVTWGVVGSSRYEVGSRKSVSRRIVQ